MLIKKQGACSMESKRAAEIFDSLGVIEVCYQGLPVWIEKLDGDRAQVQNLQTRQSFEVSVQDLAEG
jgi:H-type small acid-soluble spore protein